ncbi:MAG: hypothetical protein IKL86_00055 [Clostridia bacterium]|nr:hypothetical protein [Clostridia bacterium]
MKKFHKTGLLIVLALILALCISVFAACTPEQDTTGLDLAKEYLETQLRDAATVTGADFTRAAVLKNAHGTYTVTWTLEITSGPTTGVSLGEVTNGIQQINVDEFSSAEVVYVLTATISDDAGNTHTLTYNHKVPAFALNSHAEYVAACEANDGKTIITIKGYVIGVNADPGSSSKGSLWIMDADGHGYYVYKPALDASITTSREALNNAFPRGKEVVIKGIATNFSGGRQFNKDAEVIPTGNSVDPATLAYVDRTELYGSATSMKDAEKLEETQVTRAALNGVTMGRIDGYNYHFTVNGVDFICYMNIYLLSEEENAIVTAKWAPGSKANLTGVISTYSGNYQLYPDTVDSIEVIVENLTDEQKVERATQYANFEYDLVAKAGEVALDTTVQGYSDVTISWAIKAGESYDFASISENTLIVSALPEAETNVVLTATFTCGNASATKDFEITVAAAPVENPSYVKLTVDKLGLESQKYAAGEVTTDGYDYIFTELGNYGNGIQMRNNTHEDPNNNAASIANTTAYWAGIYQIELKYNPNKTPHNASNAFSFTFGNAADALGNEVTLTTSSTESSFVITPSATTFTFFKMQQTITGKSFYFDEIKIWLVDPATAPKTDDDKIDEEKSALNLDVLEYKANGTATLPVVGATYQEVAIAWSSEATELAIDGANLTVTAPADNKIVTITATITCGEGTAVTKEFEILFNVKPATTIAEALEAIVGVDAVLTGTVSQIKEGWSSYNNMSFNITDAEDNTIYVFRCKTQVELGDVVTVTGKIGYYNTNQIAEGSTAVIESSEGGEDEEEQKPALETTFTTTSYADIAALVPNPGDYSTDKVYAIGYLSAITNDYYGNLTIIDAEGKTLSIFTTYGFDGDLSFNELPVQPSVGDVVVLYGKANNYNGTVQLKNAWLVQIGTEVCVETVDYVLAGISVQASANADFTLSDKATWTVKSGTGIAVEGTNATVTQTGEAQTVVLTASVTVGSDTKTKDFTVVVEAAATEPIFTFGANGEASHKDGSTASEGVSYEAAGYTLTLTGLSKVNAGAYDATGNSALKLGTSSAVGTFSFTVANDVTSVKIYVAGYKANTAKVSINGGEAQTISTLSNNGEYTCITVDVSTNKTVSFTTVSGGYRAMIDTIEFIVE